MKSGLMQKRIVIMFLGLITAMALFGGVFYMCIDSNSLNSKAENILIISYIVIPVVLLLISIYKLKKTRNTRFLTYSISLLISAVVVVPVLFSIFIIVLVSVTGIMPVPS